MEQGLFNQGGVQKFTEMCKHNVRLSDIAQNTKTRSKKKIIKEGICSLFRKDGEILTAERK